jgi:uncharacterized lipoprotein YajG
MRQFLLTALVGAAIALQTGCVVGRRTVELPVPTRGASVPTAGTVYLAGVTDDRDFQNKPSDPSIPSIDGDVTTLSAAAKDQMIGRQRNGFGKAMGDIALPNGDSVTKRVGLLVEQSLIRKGYAVSTDANSGSSVSVSVKDFWGWMTPGFVALTFEAKISCVVTVTDHNGTRALLVKGYGINHGQVAKNGNWQEAFDPAFEDFITNFDMQWTH